MYATTSSGEASRLHHIYAPAQANTTFRFATLARGKAAHRYGLTSDHMDTGEALGLSTENVLANLGPVR